MEMANDRVPDGRVRWRLRPGSTAGPSAPLRVSLALSLALLPSAVGAQTIMTFDLEPAAPTTGDPLRLTAQVAFSEDCGWIPSATIAFGIQPELGPVEGWGIDLDLTPSTEACIPVMVEVPVDLDLGPIGIAAGSGVVRLRARDEVADVAFFNLEVTAGPAAGWQQPALHGSFQILIQSAGLTHVPEGLAMSDLLQRAIVIVDPDTGERLRSFRSPGSGTVRGLAFDGADLFASVRDPAGPRIYKIDLLGRVLDSFASPTVSPANAPLEGLAFHGGILYGSHDSPPILFAINPVSRQKLWERGLPTRLPGLDAAPQGLLGVDPAGTLYFIEPSPAGRIVLLADALDSGITQATQIAGYAYDGHRGFAWNAMASQMLFIRPYAVWWALDGTLRAYVPEGGVSVDVIRGEIARIRQLSGNVDLGPTLCLADDDPGGVVADLDDPPLGEAYFYLARFRNIHDVESSYGRSFPIGHRRIDFGSGCP
jgi:hypothetical protein